MCAVFSVTSPHAHAVSPLTYLHLLAEMWPNRAPLVPSFGYLYSNILRTKGEITANKDKSSKYASLRHNVIARSKLSPTVVVCHDQVRRQVS